RGHYCRLRYAESSSGVAGKTGKGRAGLFQVGVLVAEQEPHACLLPSLLTGPEEWGLVESVEVPQDVPGTELRAQPLPGDVCEFRSGLAAYCGARQRLVVPKLSPAFREIEVIGQ